MIPLTPQEIERLQELMLLTLPYLTADGAQLLSRLLAQLPSGSVDRVDITYFSLMVEDMLSNKAPEPEQRNVEQEEEGRESTLEATRAALMSLNDSLVLILNRSENHLIGRYIEYEIGR